LGGHDYFIKILFLLSKWFQTKRFLWEFPIGSYVKLSSAVVAILVEGLKCWTQIWKNSHKNLLLRNHWANCTHTLVEWSLDGPLPKLCPVIPTSSQAKIEKRGDEIKKKSSPLKLLSSAVAAILVGGLKFRTQFWKGTTQGSFQQSLVEIGSAVSEEKIFF
jgi:hypothetical protein